MSLEAPPIQEPLHSSLPDEAQKDNPQAGYIRRHWRGELSLAQSYWVNTLILSLLILAVLTWLSSHEVDLMTRAPVLVSLGMIAFWVILFVITIWQLVGLFRSARKQLATTQQRSARFWAHVVQVLVILGVITNANVLIETAGPQVIEFSKIAMGDEGYSKYTVRVLRQGTELEILGGLGFGLTDEVQRRLIANPQIRLIHLNSLGGRIGEGRKLRDLILEKKLSTYSSRGCMSACTIAYMAGTGRFLYKNAKLGFHRYTFPGFTNDQIEQETMREKATWRNAGIASYFIEKAFSTPNNEIWEPTPEELLKVGVVDNVTDGEDFAMSQMGLEGSRSPQDFDLSSIPFYAAIKKYDPAEYQKLQEEFAKLYKGDISRGEYNLLARNYSSKVLERYAPKADDESVIAMVRSIVASVKYLQTKGDEQCYAFLIADRKAIELSPEIQQTLMGTMTQVVESAASNPQPIPNQKQVSKILEKVFSKLETRYGNDVTILNQLDAPNVDRGKACIITTAMYEEVLRLPKSQSGMALRFMFGAAAESTNVN